MMMMMMSSPISFGGISSGLDTNAIISSLIAVDRQPYEKLQTKVNTTRQKSSFIDAIKTRVSTLQSNVKKFVSTSFLDEDLFQAKAATTSEDKNVGITVTDKANVGSLAVVVSRLATATKAQSTVIVGQAPVTGTKLSDIKQFTFSSGNLSLNVNGVASSLTINAAVDTFGDVLNKIKTVSGISNATINANGQIIITPTTANTVKLGATTDTSNFFRLSKLDTAVNTGATITATQPLSTVDVSQDVSTAGAKLRTLVTAGSTFKIGTATFDSTAKSLSQLITEINNKPEAGVTASFNNATNKLELVAKETGLAPIFLQDVTGNFLTAARVINAGNSLSSQTLGVTASFTVNGGAAILSNKNTVDPAVSGLTGTTLNLKTVSATAVNLTVTQDTSKLKTAVDDFIKTYNDIITTIDAQTNPKTGGLPNESSLRTFRSQLRSLVSSTNGDTTTYKSLQSLGITTGAVGSTGTGATGASSALQLDASKLTEAIANNAADVKKLFSGTNGIFTKLKTLTDEALLSGTETQGKGLFEASKDSFQAQITRLNKQIADGNARLVKKEAQYRRQFTASDQLISQYQSQGRSLSSLGS